MGFTVLNYSFLGLQPQNWYVTIKGSYQVRKIQSLMPGDNSAGLNVPGLVTPYYTITFSVYYQSSQNSPVINDSYMSFNIQTLPTPANIYLTIYEFLKGDLTKSALALDVGYNTDKQLLSFVDD